MADEELRASEKEWIVATLNKLPFVNWDRASFLIPPRVNRRRQRELWLVVYGWIDREDAYKDFIVLDFEINTGGGQGQYANVLSCSSNKHSKEVVEIIMGKETPHNPCFRTENIGGIEKCVRLTVPIPPAAAGILGVIL